ncbi:MAG: two-component regulator propeller domain-containing protein, partial [Sphingobacterium sp.]
MAYFYKKSNSMFIKPLCLFLFCSMWITLSASPYYFNHFQVNNGLSNNAILCSVQDNDGFIWFGTRGGL